jgi:hypothetical protein
MEPQIVTNLIDLVIAGIAETGGEQQFHVPANTDRNAGSRCEPEHDRDTGRRIQAHRIRTPASQFPDQPRKVHRPVAITSFDDELGQ